MVRRQFDEQMHVIGHAARLEQHAVLMAEDAAQIAVEFVLEFRSDEGAAVLGAEDRWNSSFVYVPPMVRTPAMSPLRGSRLKPHNEPGAHAPG